MGRPDSTRGKPASAAVAPDVFRTVEGERYRLTEEAREALRQLARPSVRSGRLSPDGYNLTISHQHRFMWFRVAKVATRSIFSHLAEHQVGLDVEHAMRMRYPTTLFGDYFKFGFVRHPLDRFVSAWQNKVVDTNYFAFDEPTLARMQTVERFAEWAAQLDLSDLAEADHHLALQCRLVDLSQVDHLGRLETFDRDFAAICTKIGLPPTPAAHRNRSTHPHDRGEVRSADLKSMVAEMYRKDFQIFGY